MMSVRRIRVGEAELFKQIRLTALRESPSAFGSTYESALRRTPQSWQEQADSTAQGSDRATFIAFSDDAPIGIAALYRDPEGPGLGEVLQVWVSPEYRSKGVAREIMDVLFNWAAENSFRTIIATVAAENRRALRFYRRVGFQLVTGSLLNDPEALVLMKEVSLEQAPVS